MIENKIKFLKRISSLWASLFHPGTKVNNVSEFLTETSMHGLMHLKSDKKKSTKIIWSTIIIVSLFLCTWQCVINVRDYLAYNVITKNTYETIPGIQYPAITIWNSNFFRRTILGRRLEGKVFTSVSEDTPFKQVKVLFYVQIFLSLRDEFCL